MTSYQKEYSKQLSKFLRPYFKKELKEVKRIVKNPASLKEAYEGLRMLYLAYYIVVELYEKEYPFIAKQLYKDVPDLRQLTKWRKELFTFIYKEQSDGPFCVGGNDLLKKGRRFYYRSKQGHLFVISKKHLVGFPPVLGKRVEKEQERAWKKEAQKEPLFKIVFSPETNVNEINRTIQSFVESGEKGGGKDTVAFKAASKKKFVTRTVKDFSMNFDFCFETISARSKPFGYNACLRMCKLRAKALKASGRWATYNDKFIESFAAEYEKRLRFLTLAALFVKEAHKQKKNAWFLRDQIEPYLLKKSLDVLTKQTNQEDRFLMVSRNSVSRKKEDHHGYEMINSWYYKAANKAKKGTYKEFATTMQKSYEQACKKEPFLKEISEDIIEHLWSEGVLEDKKKEHIHFIDTGFQGTFNIFLEVILNKWAKEQKKQIKTSHYLMGVWPWLESILKGKHLTTYFPIVLIVEFFDGIHEFVQFDRFDGSEPLFKQADNRHQLPLFLDLLLIHDVSIAVHRLYWDKRKKEYRKSFSI